MPPIPHHFLIMKIACLESIQDLIFSSNIFLSINKLPQYIFFLNFWKSLTYILVYYLVDLQIHVDLQVFIMDLWVLMDIQVLVEIGSGTLTMKTLRGPPQWGPPCPFCRHLGSQKGSTCSCLEPLGLFLDLLAFVKHLTTNHIFKGK